MERGTDFAFVDVGTFKTEHYSNHNILMMKCENTSDAESDSLPRKPTSFDNNSKAQENTLAVDSIPSCTHGNNELYYEEFSLKTSSIEELKEEKWSVRDSILVSYSPSYSESTKEEKNNTGTAELSSFERDNDNNSEKCFTELLPLVISPPKDLYFDMSSDPHEKIGKNSEEFSNIKISLSPQKELHLEEDCSLVLKDEESLVDDKENIIMNAEHMINIKKAVLTDYKEDRPEVVGNNNDETADSKSNTNKKRGRGRPRVLIKKTHPCSVCLKVFSRKTHLTTHLRIHSDEKPYMCTLCGKRFRDNSVLIKHIRVHTQDKPYACTVCGKAFNQKGNMERHARQHTNEKPFICLFCQNAFSNNSHLQRHFRIHVNEKPFTCELCEKSFRQKSHLMRHVLVHSREKPYSCNLCNKRFRQEQHVSRHKKTHIKDMITNILVKNCITKSTSAIYI